MAKAQHTQIEFSKDSTRPPFPGGWLLAVFDALDLFAPAFAAKHRVPVSRRTQERIKRAEVVKLQSYHELEIKLVELITVVFPKVSAVNAFATKYVNEYFRLWKCAAEVAPKWVNCLGFKPGEPIVIARALVRDLILRLCYLESCERQLTRKNFEETELAFLRYDCPAQVYHMLISERLRKMSQGDIANELKTSEKTLLRFQRGESRPSHAQLRTLTESESGVRLVAAIGFIDQLLKRLGLHKSVLRSEFLSIASVFFRHHPRILQKFRGTLLLKVNSGRSRKVRCRFEEYTKFGDNLLLHPGFEELRGEMPDALWRAHVSTLQFARISDLTQTYFQFSTEASDQGLASMLAEAEREQGGHAFGWMDKLRQRNKSRRLS